MEHCYIEVSEAPEGREFRFVGEPTRAQLLALSGGYWNSYKTAIQEAHDIEFGNSEWQRYYRVIDPRNLFPVVVTGRWAREYPSHCMDVVNMHVPEKFDRFIESVELGSIDPRSLIWPHLRLR